MITLIETAEKGVHFSNTVNQPIQIEKIVIERNLRPRRALELTEETTEVKQVKTVKKVKRELVVNDLPDYSKMSLVELDKKHKLYQNMGEVGRSALVVAELKRRGVFKK